WDVLGRLEVWDLPVSQHNVRLESIDDAVEACLALERRRGGLAFDVDGAVVKIDDRTLQAELGTAGREPRWAIAYKFAPAQATTTLQHIGINVGRTGSLTPFAVLEPVDVGGATLRLAVLHNEEDIHRKDIRVGDTVLVQRAGEVMPYVLGPLLDRRPPGTVPYVLPDRCPVCRSTVSHGDGEAVARCTGTFRTCSAQLRELTNHFCSRPAMDIRAVGPQLVTALIERRLLSDPADLYFLTAPQLEEIDRMGGRSARRVLQSLAESKKQPFRRVLFAIGVRHVGARTAELLAAHFKSIDWLRAASVADIQAVEGIGMKIGKSVFEVLRMPEYVTFVDKLSRAGVQLSIPREEAAGPLAGLTFAVTGRLHHYSRSAFEEHLQSLGASVASGVTRKTDYLVVGHDPSSKYQRAQKLGVAILTEDGFASFVAARRAVPQPYSSPAATDTANSTSATEFTPTHTE
ncbi:MAG TPA: NAD-dependent DNA ligase LigA, partial [Chloroflexota bacterium]|nr:NAD-dependent DNA ligase LigA [Chloroflexota bacterium]